MPVAPTVTTQPHDASAGGGTVSFTAAATGDPQPLVQWQSMASGADWANIDGATNDMLTVDASSYPVGTQFRAVFTNLAGSALSDAATLRG
jgi:hypothetical protein